MAVKTKIKPTVKTLDEAVILMLERMAESNDRTDRLIAESNDRTDRVMAESQAKTDLAIQRLTENLEGLRLRVAEVLTSLGTTGNRLGDIVELVVIPGLRHAVNAHGHCFRNAVANKSFMYIGKNGQKQEIAELDLFLSNGTEVMAVEIKNTLSVGYVNRCLSKLKRLREFEKETKIERKKLYGAVVGVYIDPDARRFALKNGLYVIDILEEEKKLKVDKPGRPRVW
jgi:hypothetical protein